MTEDIRSQVIAQCKVVSHLATALAGLYGDYAVLMESTGSTDILDQVGGRTASIMEALGNMLNGVDAVDVTDEWVNPIFAEAQRLWPVGERPLSEGTE